ncbi:MAG: hypothetical protein ACJAS9_001712 [Polaribacter sp.]|jgi:hypothetical protein
MCEKQIIISKKLILAISLLFFSFNVSAIECINSEPCPSHIKKVKKFARYGSPSAQVMMATLYLEGDIVKQNLKKSFNWLRKATSHLKSLNLADHLLGVAYVKGLGTEKNVDKGIKLLTKAAEKGFVKSQLLLGIIYYEGKGTSKNLKESFKWLQLAANEKNSTASYLVAHMLENELGVKRSIKDATKWYVIAASLKHPQAMQKLELMKDRKIVDAEFIKQQAANAQDGNIIEITRSKIPRMELLAIFVDQIKETKIYQSVAPTGSLIPGKICGESSNMCKSHGNDRLFDGVSSVLSF